MKRTLGLGMLFCACLLAGCTSLGEGGYGLSDYAEVKVKRVKVGDGSLSVVPPRPWNRRKTILFDDVPSVEEWTQNGPLLDGITFITGLKSGHFMVRQRRSSEQQVPKFRSDMTPPEIAEMLEGLYRVRGGAVDFRTLSIEPRAFLGLNGFQFDYEHLDDDELWRKGRAVGVVVKGELYLVMLDAARSHYYPSALPDFEAIVASARLEA
ncbi:MAG TPA: hypothetical protein VLM36_03865 [Sphingomicrobium sp.]|nr:hypothetical protein [Sphingomicrobium sp.]